MLRLKKELSLFKNKEKKVNKQLGKSVWGMKKNQTPLEKNGISRENLMKLSEKKNCQILQQKSLKDLAETIEKDVFYATTLGDEYTTPKLHFSLAKPIIKQNYALVDTSKPV